MHGYLNGAMNVQNGVDLLGQKGCAYVSHMHTTIPCQRLQFSTLPSPPLFILPVQDRFECLLPFFIFFIRISLVYNKRDPSFHHRPHGNAPRRGACDEFSRVTELGGDSRGNFRIFEGMTGRKGCKIRGDWCIRYLWNDVEKEKEIWSHSFLLSFFFFVKGRIIGWITCKENNSLNTLVTIPIHIPYTYFLFFLRICINKYRYIHKKYSPLNHPI